MALHTAHTASGQATPTLMADLYSHHAAALSATHQAAEARAALDNAQAAFADSDPAEDPPWQHWYTECDLYWEYGSVYRDLAALNHTTHGAQAIDWATTAHNTTPADGSRQWMRGLTLIGLTAACLLAREPEAAIQHGKHMLEETRLVKSTRITDRLIRLRGLLLPYHQLDGIRDLDQQIHETVTPARRTGQ